MRFFVAGLCNLETTVKVQSFPLEYQAVRYPFFGIGSAPSGVGFNLCAALLALGAEVQFCTFVGADALGHVVQKQLEEYNAKLLLESIPEHPQSVILIDQNGQRAILTDLKDIQERQMPHETLQAGLENASAALICNINFARPALHFAQASHIPIYTDLHTIAHLENPYDQEFLESANVVFFSAEHLPDPRQTAQEALRRFANIQVIVVGMGAQGAWLFERGQAAHLEPSIPNPKPQSTVGAGDALFSSFAYFHQRLANSRAALAYAVRFASHKLGFAGGATGFLSANELLEK
jgi:acarbose 7IV-phosphotransferase